MSLTLPTAVEKPLLESPITSTILERWSVLGIPNAWLVAGVIVQTYWNFAHGLPYDHGIDDADIVYFDPSDLKVGASERIERPLR